MTDRAPAWRRLASAAAVLIALVLMPLLIAGLTPGSAAMAAESLAPMSYRCSGDPLTAQLIRGAMDDPTLPDPSDSPVPVGGSVLLQWRDQRLQLPRTNNAGPASFSDGRWWWSLEDPAHPRFRLRRGPGVIVDFACEAPG